MEGKKRVARISKMRENYISLRKKGHSNVEIAEKYGVNRIWIDLNQPKKPVYLELLEIFFY